MLFARYFRNLEVAIFNPPEPETARDGESKLANHETTSNTASQAKKTEKSIDATARARPHAGSPQRPGRDQDAFARRHSESASMRRISAEGSPRARRMHRSESASTRRISANPLRRLRASKRSRCGAVRVCLELGVPSAEIARVEALSLCCRANLSGSR